MSHPSTDEARTSGTEDALSHQSLRESTDLDLDSGDGKAKRRGRGWWLVGAALALGAVLWAVATPRAAPDVAAIAQQMTVLSDVYEVDRKYRSMMGPYGTDEVRLGSVDDPELLWITGFEAVMMDATGDQRLPQEFMCHSNLDLDLAAHHDLLGINSGYSSRLFTLSQGQLSIRFPDGFGIPVLSSEPLELTTQVLNLNYEGDPLGVRHRIQVHYVRDQDLGSPFKALFPGSAYGLKLIDGDDGYFGIETPEGETHGPGCLVGENASDHEYDDGLGRTFSGHWVVAPGREVNHTLVTQLMRLPYDTTLHYIAVHLHPFAESLELRDLTADQTVFKSRAENFEDRIGLARVDSFSSEEGIPLYADHEYEMISVYNNTTDTPQDSMAVMYLYSHDKHFESRWKTKRRQVLGAAASAGGH